METESSLSQGVSLKSKGQGKDCGCVKTMVYLSSIHMCRTRIFTGQDFVSISRKTRNEKSRKGESDGKYDLGVLGEAVLVADDRSESEARVLIAKDVFGSESEDDMETSHAVDKGDPDDDMVRPGDVQAGVDDSGSEEVKAVRMKRTYLSVAGQNSSKRQLSDARQLGCVFQDMTPPKSFLRKSSDMQKPIQRAKFTKAIARRTQNSIPKSFARIYKYISTGEPHQYSSNASKFEDRFQEERLTRTRSPRSSVEAGQKCN